jgi:acetylglutamate kinase
LSKLIIVKIGGHILDNEEDLHNVLKSFVIIKEPKILIHGGGKVASEIAEKFGIIPRVINGRRITDAETLKIVQMVYAGLLNKNIVLKLQSLNCDAIGMSGADANCILAHKREITDIDYGYAGDIDQVNAHILRSLLKLRLTPVLCALTHDGNAQMLNTNADTIAAEVGAALSNFFNVELIYCIDKEGVLRSKEQKDSVISKISRQSYQECIRKSIISDGMIPKLHNAFYALDKGVKQIHIIHFNALARFNTQDMTGTIITKR